MADFPRSQQVSAIVVVRNGERFLRDALQSIAAQTRPPDEILVIDGQSSDSTAQIAQS
ncbi:MAG: glycosyltransferase, partial [Caldilinea sp.]|nr:glycosyltransferase [Caldilinea sp.]